MRKKKNILCILMAALMLIMSITVMPVHDTEAATAKLNKTSLTLYTKTMYQLQVLNSNLKTTWTSSNSNVASVTSSGFVSARSAGKAKITAVNGKKRLYCTVTVKVKPGEEIKMDFKDYKSTVGRTFQLRLVNATSVASWKSSNTKVATVDGNGTVTCKKAGSATITATLYGKKYTCSVTVSNKAASNVSQIRRMAPLADKSILNAFEKLKFSVIVDRNVNEFTGRFSVSDHNIIVKYDDHDCIYHELGHFLSWLDGNLAYTKEFKAIYDKEKDKVTFFNKNYVTKDTYEYFAESYKDYVLHRSTLSSTRPETYKYIRNAVTKANKMTNAELSRKYENYKRGWKE